MKTGFLAQSRSFGRNGKPCEHKSDFFLVGNSDQRKLVASQRKNTFMEQAWNEKLDWLQPKKNKIVIVRSTQPAS